MGGKSAWNTRNYKQTSMFLCFHVKNYIKTRLLVFSPFSAYFYPPPMDKGPLGWDYVGRWHRNVYIGGFCPLQEGMTSPMLRGEALFEPTTRGFSPYMRKSNISMSLPNLMAVGKEANHSPLYIPVYVGYVCRQL